MPKLQGIDDEGYYRRLFILPFDKRFSSEEINKFDKKQILTQEALDYFANISLKAYLDMVKNKRKFSFFKESCNIIKKYRQAINSAELFLNDQIAIADIFQNNNTIKKTAMYARYVNWCNENKFFVDNKKIFYDKVLLHTEYTEINGQNGYECFRNMNFVKNSNALQMPKTF